MLFIRGASFISVLPIVGFNCSSSELLLGATQCRRGKVEDLSDLSFSMFDMSFGDKVHVDVESFTPCI